MLARTIRQWCLRWLFTRDDVARLSFLAEQLECDTTRFESFQVEERVFARYLATLRDHTGWLRRFVSELDQALTL